MKPECWRGDGYKIMIMDLNGTIWPDYVGFLATFSCQDWGFANRYEDGVEELRCGIYTAEWLMYHKISAG